MDSNETNNNRTVTGQINILPTLQKENQNLFAQSPPGPEPEPPAAGDEIGLISPAGSSAPPPPTTTSSSADRRPPKRKKNGRSGRWLRLCYVVPLIVLISYGLAGFLLVPTLIKGPLAARLSAHLARPVQISTALFSPFKLHLHLSGVLVGPEHDDSAQSGLLTCAALDFDLNFLALLRGVIAVENVTADRLSLQLIRYSSTDYNLTRLYKKIMGEIREKKKFWYPKSVTFNRVEFVGGAVDFDDQPAGKKHRLEHIHFLLPLQAETLGEGQTTPQLSAIFNGSPIHLTGVHQKNPAGHTETKLSLHLDRLDLAEYQQYLPALTEELRLEEGAGSCDLELVITDPATPQRQIALRGSGNFRNMLVNRRNKQPYLKIPSARLSLRANPLFNRYQFEEIILNAPEYYPRITMRAHAAPAAPAADLETLEQHLADPTFDICLDHFLIDQGTILIEDPADKTNKTTWRDLHFSLNGFCTQPAGTKRPGQAPEGSFSFSGTGSQKKPAASFSGQGRLSSALIMTGQLTLHNIEISTYQGLVLANHDPHFTAGTFDYTGHFAYRPPAETTEESATGSGLQFQEGSLVARNFSVAAKEKNLFSGAELACNNIKADFGDKQFSCQRIEMVKNEFSSGWWESALTGISGSGKKRWNLTLQELTIRESVAHALLPVHKKQNITATLSDLELRAKDLGQSGQTQDNVSLKATVNQEGQLLLNGAYSFIKGTGLFKTSLKNIELATLEPLYTEWLTLTPVLGKVSGEGSVELPLQRFSGTLRLEDFAAGNPQQRVIAWQSAAAHEVALTLNPFYFGASEITIQQPALNMSQPAALTPTSILIPPQKGKVQGNGSPFEIKKVLLRDGRYIPAQPLLTEGFQPEIRGIAGTLSDLHARRPLSFDLTGELLAPGTFHVRGSADFHGVQRYDVEVDNLPLQQFDQLFREQIGAGTTEAVASWHQWFAREPAGEKKQSTLLFQKLQPEVDSDYFDLFALLLGDNDTLTLSMNEERGGEERDLRFFESFFKRLGLYRAKAVVAPELIVAEFLPELNLAPALNFPAGQSQTEELELLGDYIALLQKRARIGLVVTGGIDPVADHKALEDALRAEAEKKRTAENQRRAEKRAQLAAKRQEQLAAIKPDSKQITVETISAEELEMELQPLPPLGRIEVKTELIAQLAAQRAKYIQNYFVDRLGVAERRISVVPDYLTTGSQVRIKLKAIRDRQ